MPLDLTLDPESFDHHIHAAVGDLGPRHARV
jgi:hypothetical protein